MPAIYASLTVLLLFGAVSVAIYAAIYGINRPFDDRIADMGVKMRVAYGNPDNWTWIPTRSRMRFSDGSPSIFPNPR